MHTATVTDYTNKCVACQVFYEKKLLTEKQQGSFFSAYNGRMICE